MTYRGMGVWGISPLISECGTSNHASTSTLVESIIHSISGIHIWSTIPILYMLLVATYNTVSQHNSSYESCKKPSEDDGNIGALEITHRNEGTTTYQ